MWASVCTSGERGWRRGKVEWCWDSGGGPSSRTGTGTETGSRHLGGAPDIDLE